MSPVYISRVIRGSGRPTGAVSFLLHLFSFSAASTLRRSGLCLSLSVDNPAGRINDDEWISDDEGLFLLLMD